MAAVVIGLDDLTPFIPGLSPVKAAEMIADAMATATLVAPCIATPEFELGAAAKAIIRGAIVRWSEAGSGVTVTETAGPFSHSIAPEAKRGRLFWPTEIADLAKLCGKVERTAFTVDTAPGGVGIHTPWCSIMMGANYCSCGADIAGFPIYGADGEFLPSAGTPTPPSGGLGNLVLG